MSKQTLWDEELKELNTIELNHKRKMDLLNHIRAKTKKGNAFQKLKYSLITTAALAIFLTLATSISDEKGHNKSSNMAASDKNVTAQTDTAKKDIARTNAPQTKTGTNQTISQNDSNQWEVISRLRYDLGVIQTIQTIQNQMVITVKRLNSFGTDPDPLGPVIKPDTDTRDYRIKTSQTQQITQLKVNQQVLLLFGQYLPKDATDPIWAAEVVGETKEDGKLYNSKGELLNVTISTNVQVLDGEIKIAE